MYQPSLSEDSSQKKWKIADGYLKIAQAFQATSGILGKVLDIYKKPKAL